MVVDGELFDNSFNQSAHQGLIKAMQELECDIKVFASKNATENENYLRTLASSKYDLILAIGYITSEAIPKVAGEFPDVKFTSIDGNLPEMRNVSVYRFREEEGSFLVGALAAMVSHNKKLGFVGGAKVPLIEKFEAGYKAGALTAYPAIEVFTDYTDCFDKPDYGKEMTKKQIDEGATVIYHASGACGTGVIDVIHDKGTGYYAIGVDSDQDALAPGRVLTSMIKRVDTAVYDSIKAVKEGRFAPGVTSLGIKEDGISLSPMTYTKNIIITLNGSYLPQIDHLSNLIKNSSIQVPDSLDKLKSFKIPENSEWR
jgi:basic membrane protein A